MAGPTVTTEQVTTLLEDKRKAFVTKRNEIYAKYDRQANAEIDAFAEQLMAEMKRIAAGYGYAVELMYRTSGGPRVIIGTGSTFKVQPKKVK